MHAHPTRLRPTSAQHAARRAASSRPSRRARRAGESAATAPVHSTSSSANTALTPKAACSDSPYLAGGRRCSGSGWWWGRGGGVCVGLSAAPDPSPDPAPILPTVADAAHPSRLKTAGEARASAPTRASGGVGAASSSESSPPGAPHRARHGGVPQRSRQAMQRAAIAHGASSRALSSRCRMGCAASAAESAMARLCAVSSRRRTMASRP
jgi:hypothetical protein